MLKKAVSVLIMIIIFLNLSIQIYADSWTEANANRRNNRNINAIITDNPSEIDNLATLDEPAYRVKFSSPVIDDEENIYILNGNYIYSFDKNGQERWKKTVDTYNTELALSNDKETIYYIDRNGVLFSLNTLAGEENWKYDTEYNTTWGQSSPGIDPNGNIIFSTPFSNNARSKSVYCISPNGALNWEYKTGYRIVNEHPIIDKDNNSYFIVNRDSDNLDLFLRISSNGISDFTNTLPNGSLIDNLIMDNNENLLAMDIYEGYLYKYNKNGNLIWTLSDFVGYSSLYSGLSTDKENTIYLYNNISGTSSVIKAINTDRSEKWDLELDYSISGGIMTDLNGTVFAPGTNKVTALNSNGTIKWQLTTTGTVEQISMAASGKIYFIADNNLYVINDNEVPTISIVSPLNGAFVGNEDKINITGSVKDKDVGDIINIKYSIGNIENLYVNLTQPNQIIANGQEQSFIGNIKLNNINTGEYVLELWAFDNKDGKSNVVEIPIIIFNTLENILYSLKSYMYNEKMQFFIINSNTTITQNTENDRLIEEIKKELKDKNIKAFFIGENGSTEDYLKSKLVFD